MSEKKQIQKKLNNEIGVSGLEAYAGKVQDDPLSGLQGIQGARIYRQMSENDPVVGALLFAIKGLIGQVEWKFVPYSESDEDVANADFLEECKGDMESGFADYIEEIMSFLEFGFSLSELSYKRRNGYKRSELFSSKYNDGKIGWKRLPPRAQDSILDGYWDYDEETQTLKGVWQYPVTGGAIYIPIERLLHVRTRIGKMNPQGRSILRNAYRPWYFKSRIENYEAIGVERDLAGMPTAYCPAEWFDPASKFHKQFLALKEIVTTVKRDEQEGLVLPNIFDENGNRLISFELLSSSAKRNFNTGEIINRKNDEILMTALADFIKLGQNTVGSHALAFSKTEIFTTSLKGWVRKIEDAFNRQAIPRLMRLNGFNGDMPKLIGEGIDKIDGTIFLQNLKLVTEAGYGYMLDEQIEGKIRSLLRLPDAGREQSGGNNFDPRSAMESGAIDLKGNPVQQAVEQTGGAEEEEE